MLNLNHNPLFWPNQADVVVDQNKSNIFIGIGIATKTELSKTVPFVIIGFLLSAEFIKRQVFNSHVILLIADQHAWLANHFDQEKSQFAADNLELIIKKILTNFNLADWQVFRASQVFPNTLPQSYEELETRDVSHFFRKHDCGLKIGWSFSMANNQHKTDELHFDEKLDLPIHSIFTKPGVTSNPNKPFESPYICTDPTTRITINKHSIRKLNTNPAVKNHLNRITILFEHLVETFPNKTPLENKVKLIINKILC